MATGNTDSKSKRLMDTIGDARDSSLKTSTIMRTLQQVEGAVTSSDDDSDTQAALLVLLKPVSQQAAIFGTIATLYSSVYANEPHRLNRLLGLMLPYDQAISDLQAGIETRLKEHASSVKMVSELNSFKVQLQRVHQCVIKERDEGDGGRIQEDVVEQPGVVSNVVVSISQERAVPAVEEQMPVALYMKQRGRLRWKRDAPQLSGWTKLREEDLRIITYHRLQGSFQSLRTVRETLFNGVWIDRDEFSQLRFDPINALWLSPAFDLVVDGVRDQGGYQRLLDAVMEVPEPSRRQNYCCTPLHLATAMSKLSIDVGFIFSEEPTHVVWPLGNDSGNAHTITLLCNKEIRHWRYTAVEHFAEGQSRRKQPTLTFEQLLRRGPSSVQADLQGVVNRSVKGWKPFPFPNLPAELRLKIYDHYLVAGNYQEQWGPIYHVRLPELAKTCRQVRDEILPVVVSGLILEVQATSRRRFRDADLLRPEKSWMALPGAANIRYVFFSMPHGRRCRFDILPAGKGYRMPKLQLDSSSPEHLKVQAEAFPELVKIIADDRTTPGLSLIDIAAMLGFGYAFLRA